MIRPNFLAPIGPDTNSPVRAIPGFGLVSGPVRATGIAKAAEACAEGRQPEKGLEIVLDVEQLIYEATTLLNGASLINRCAKS